MSTFNVRMENEGNYIICEASGNLNKQVLIEMIMKVHKYCFESDIHKCLMDWRQAQNGANAFQIYEIAYIELREIRISRQSKIAALISSDDRSHDFSETAVRNAGYMMKLFQEEAAALEWLLND